MRTRVGEAREFFTQPPPARTERLVIMRFQCPAVTALALSLAACNHFDSTDSITADDGAVPSTDADGGAGDSGVKGEPVTGTPDPNTITEEHGVFVAPSGNDRNDGSRSRPYATLAAGITRAAQIGKIVFACTGTYAEALVVADSISLIGGLDCSGPEWKTGAAPSRLESPTSPAITAKSIMSQTRIEAFEVVAPSATDAGASSIGLFADHAPGLYVANSKITAGDGAPGADGINPSALFETGAVDGKPSPSPARVLIITTPPGAVGGRSTCGGGAVGIGGSGGLWQVQEIPSGFFWVAYGGTPNGGGGLSGGLPGGVGGGASTVDGNNGAVASDLGTLTADGYVPSDGHAGGHGSAGRGGAGGVGGTLADMGAAQSSYQASNWSGVSGPGGGAGGCAGLAGSPGAGGGGSFGVALVESVITLENVAVTSGNGGAAGRGTLGADPTPGGAAGTNAVKGSAGATAGGRGGYAGMSTNGSNGPSIGIAFTTTAPLLKGTTKATPGSGAPAIDAVPDPTSSRSIPATPAGVSIEMRKL